MDTEETATLTPHHLSAVYSPILAGSFLGLFGLGILLAQAASYAERFPHDRFFFKLTVAVLVALNVVQSVGDCTRLVKVFSLHFGDFEYFSAFKTRIEDFICPLTGILIQAICQSFLASRSIQFALLRSRSPSATKRSQWARTASLVTMGVTFGGWILATAALGVGMMVALSKCDTYADIARGSERDHGFRVLKLAWLSTSCIVDIFLTVIISTEFLSAKTGTAATGQVINSFVKLIVPNGFGVAFLEIISLFLFLKSTSSWSSFPGLFISKIYSNTAIALITRPREVKHRREVNAVLEGRGGDTSAGDTIDLGSQLEEEKRGGSRRGSRFASIGSLVGVGMLGFDLKPKSGGEDLEWGGEIKGREERSWSAATLTPAPLYRETASAVATPLSEPPEIAIAWPSNIFSPSPSNPAPTSAPASAEPTPTGSRPRSASIDPIILRGLAPDPTPTRRRSSIASILSLRNPAAEQEKERVFRHGSADLGDIRREEEWHRVKVETQAKRGGRRGGAGEVAPDEGDEEDWDEEEEEVMVGEEDTVGGAKKGEGSRGVEMGENHGWSKKEAQEFLSGETEVIEEDDCGDLNKRRGALGCDFA